MKILLSGASGFIGKFLCQSLLEQKHEIYFLSRSPKVQSTSHLHYVIWNPESTEAWSLGIKDIDAIINLAGEPIAAKRWSREQKEKIVASRVCTTRALVEFIQAANPKPRVLINASGIGYYGAHPQGPVTESHAAGTDFLGRTCTVWESEALRATSLGVRTVLLRLGAVLEKEGGALAKLLPPFQFFVGGPLGNGKQPFPWIHRSDVVRVLLWALDTPAVTGPLNLVAPQQVNMKEFCTALGKVLKRPSWAPVPGWFLKALLGEMSELLLGGQEAIPEKLQKLGFKFQFPELKTALEAIFLTSTK